MDDQFQFDEFWFYNIQPLRPKNKDEAEVDYHNYIRNEVVNLIGKLYSINPVMLYKYHISIHRLIKFHNILYQPRCYSYCEMLAILNKILGTKFLF